MAPAEGETTMISRAFAFVGLVGLSAYLCGQADAQTRTPSGKTVFESDFRTDPPGWDLGARPGEGSSSGGWSDPDSTGDRFRVQERGYWMSPTVSASPSSEYELTFRFRARDGGRWDVVWYDASGSKLYAKGCEGLYGCPEWAQQQVRFRAPARTVRCRVRFWPIESSIYLDDIRMVEVGPTGPENLCRRARGEIRIDGRDDEPAWRMAQRISDFAPHWDGRPATTSTRAKLLWDDHYLYFFAEMEDADLYADVTEHDGMTWHGDVFELFFKPAEDKLGYYEFQVNALNTQLDMFLPSRGSGGYRRWASRGKFHMKSAVVLQGTVNRWKDVDTGWSVEGRVPWGDFAPTGWRPRAGDCWRFNLCRYDYSKTLERPELSCCSPLTRPDFHCYEDYATLRFEGEPGE
jgi:hypothetical protein